MPAYSKGNVPPVIPSKPKTFIERRSGPRDRRVIKDRRAGNASDRRLSISSDQKLPVTTLVRSEGENHVLAKAPQRADAESAPAQEMRVDKSHAADKVTKTALQAPVVVDALDVDKSRRVYTVKPEVFMDIVDRLNLQMVIHYQKRQGMNIYFIQFEGGVVETQTPNRLSMLDSSEHDMERPTVSEVPEKSVSQAESIISNSALRGSGEVERTEYQSGQQEKVVASTKKRPLMEYRTEEGYYVTEWWNSPDDPALSVARIRIEPGATTSTYELHGVTERYLFLTGKGVVEIDDKQYEVVAGDGLLVKAGARRRVTNRGDRDLGFLAICRPRFSRLSEEPMLNKFVKVV